jgi:hypothetical protein
MIDTRGDCADEARLLTSAEIERQHATPHPCYLIQPEVATGAMRNLNPGQATHDARGISLLPHGTQDAV